MSYQHGVTITEVPTSLVSPVKADSGLPFVVGTAPVHLVDPSNVNKVKLCNNYAEAVAAFGYSTDWASYTLCEFIYSHFALFATGPVVLVNVFDPALPAHITEVEAESHTLNADGQATLTNLGGVLSSVVVKVGEATKTIATDYTLAFDDDGKIVISRVTTGTILADDTLLVDYNKFNPAGITADDIIGGVNGTTGALTGLELVNRVFPQYQKVPGLILAPGWSHDSGVAAVMVAKAQVINQVFKAVALTDLSASGSDIPIYTDATSWKNTNNFTSPFQYNCWPLCKLGTKTFHMSTQVAGRINRLDAINKGLPYQSPSNQPLQMDSAVNAGGTEIWLDTTQANYLNENGIATAINMGGWKLWGNETGGYPGTTDVKDRFLANRRMTNWLANTIILTYAQKVDNPTNTKLIQSIVDSLNSFLNGLIGTGALLGGRVEFLEEENPVTDLLAGTVRFHVYQASPVPAQNIDFTLEFDTSYLATLFA